MAKPRALANTVTVDVIGPNTTAVVGRNITIGYQIVEYN